MKEVPKEVPSTAPFSPRIRSKVASAGRDLKLKVSCQMRGDEDIKDAEILMNPPRNRRRPKNQEKETQSWKKRPRQMKSLPREREMNKGITKKRRSCGSCEACTRPPRGECNFCKRPELNNRCVLRRCHQKVECAGGGTGQPQASREESKVETGKSKEGGRTSSPPKTAPNRRNELPNDLSADVGMENDSVSLSLQETTEAEPGIEAETNMGSAADDGYHDQVEEQMRLMFSEESPHGQIFSAQQDLEGSQENGRLQAEENGIKRGEQSKDVDRLEVAKVAGHNVGLGEMANLNSIIDSSGLISNRDSAENSTSKISVMGCDLNDKDEHKVVEQQVKEEVLCSQLAQELISKYKEPPAPLTDSTVKVELPSGCLSLPDTRSLEEEASDDDDDVILMEELTEEDMQLALSRSAVGDIDEPRSEISGQEPLKTPAGESEDETDIFIKEVQEILDSAAIERGARKPGGLLGNAKTPRRDERYKARARTEVSRGKREEIIFERLDQG